MTSSTDPLHGFARLLVPVDFAEAGRRILGVAARAARPDARVVLLHVVERMPQVTEAALGIYPHRQDLERIKDLAEEKLRERSEAFPGRDIILEVREGKPAPSILEAIQEHEPDLVVMGTHGRSALDHFLIGSVAERVMRKTTADVLLVRE